MCGNHKSVPDGWTDEWKHGRMNGQGQTDSIPQLRWEGLKMNVTGSKYMFSTIMDILGFSKEICNHNKKDKFIHSWYESMFIGKPFPKINNNLLFTKPQAGKFIKIEIKSYNLL